MEQVTENSCVSEVLSYSLLFHSGKVSNKAVAQDYEEKINIHQSYWGKKLIKLFYEELSIMHFKVVSIMLLPFQ